MTLRFVQHAEEQHIDIAQATADLRTTGAIVDETSSSASPRTRATKAGGVLIYMSQAVPQNQYAAKRAMGHD